MLGIRYTPSTPGYEGFVTNRYGRALMAKKPARDPYSLLGCIVKDLVTGFTGMAVAVTEYAYGCTHINVQPIDLADDGATVKKGHLFDDGRVELVEYRKVRHKILRPKVELGNIVKHDYNGLVAFVSSKTTWLDQDPDLGLDPITLKPDGSPGEMIYVPEKRVTVIEKKTPPVASKSPNPPGGPGGPVPAGRERRF